MSTSARERPLQGNNDPQQSQKTNKFLQSVQEMNHGADFTPMALLEQLNYVETHLSSASSSTTLEEQLNNDLAIFANDSFIFPDEEKPSFENGGSSSSNTHNNDNANQNGSLHFNNLFEEFGGLGNRNQREHNNNQLDTHGGIVPTSVIITKEEVNQQRDIISDSLVALLSAQSLDNSNPLINTVATGLLEHLPKYEVPEGARKSLLISGLTQIQIDALAALIYQQKKLNRMDSDLGLTPGSIASETEMTPAIANSIFNNFTFDHNVDADQYASQGDASTLSTTVQDILSPPFTSHRRSSSKQSVWNASSGSDVSSNSEQIDEIRKRRNTAASARFRIKKRIEEREMERSIRDLNSNVRKLRLRIEQLEAENKVLKDIIIDKNDK